MLLKMMQTILNQLTYFGFSQGLFFFLIYILSPAKRKNVNPYMAFLIFVLLIGLSGKVLHSMGVWNQNFRLIAFSEFSALLFGSTVYLFTRSVLNKRKISRQDLIHYIPGLAYSLFILVYFMLPSDEISRARAATGEIKRAIFACHAIGVLVNGIYWYLSWKVLQDFYKRIRNEVSYELHTAFIVRFLYVVGACLLIWTILYITSLLGYDMIERNARPYIWGILTLIILFINYYGIISPQVFHFVPDITSKKYAQSKLTVSDMERLKQELDTLMQEKKPYLNSKLLKAEVAQMLGINNPELARLLNENIGMNFFEYVNYYRIKEFINLAKTEKAKQLTFFGLAQEAGFNSKTTFNKSFKKLTGTSPSAYFNQNTYDEN
ncbi:AraC family transcriptional regulator [Aquimarina hainanensis]